MVLKRDPDSPDGFYRSPVDGSYKIACTDPLPQDAYTTSQQITKMMSGELLALKTTPSDFDYDEDSPQDPSDQVPLDKRDGFTLDDVQPAVERYKTARNTYQDAYDTYTAKLTENAKKLAEKPVEKKSDNKPTKSE